MSYVSGIISYICPIKSCVYCILCVVTTILYLCSIIAFWDMCTVFVTMDFIEQLVVICEAGNPDL